MAARCVNAARRLAEPPLRELPSVPKADQQLLPSQVLLPLTTSVDVSSRRRAVGRLVALSRFLQVRGLRCRRPLGTPQPFLLPPRSRQLWAPCEASLGAGQGIRQGSALRQRLSPSLWEPAPSRAFLLGSRLRPRAREHFAGPPLAALPASVPWAAAPRAPRAEAAAAGWGSMGRCAGQSPPELRLARHSARGPLSEVRAFVGPNFFIGRSSALLQLSPLSHRPLPPQNAAPSSSTRNCVSWGR